MTFDDGKILILESQLPKWIDRDKITPELLKEFNKLFEHNAGIDSNHDLKIK